jgi:hypothetical protein
MPATEVEEALLCGDSSEAQDERSVARKVQPPAQRATRRQRQPAVGIDPVGSHADALSLDPVFLELRGFQL